MRKVVLITIFAATIVTLMAPVSFAGLKTVNLELPWQPKGDGFYIHLTKEGKVVYTEKCQSDALNRHLLAWRFADMVANALVDDKFSVSNEHNVTPDITILPFCVNEDTSFVNVVDPHEGKYIGQPKLTKKNFDSVLKRVLEMIRDQLSK